MVQRNSRLGLNSKFSMHLSVRVFIRFSFINKFEAQHIMLKDSRQRIILDLDGEEWYGMRTKTRMSTELNIPV
jgi:hypothetical protein